jgi:hypothetical protein
MGVTTGTRLGPYEILSPLGASFIEIRVIFGSHHSNWTGILPDQRIGSDKGNTFYSCLCN